MILTTLIVGLAGALLMFCGDMTLYYDKNDFIHDGTINPIVNIMKKLPPLRVMIGGWIGPVAAFLLCCLGIIAGGAYHSHCAYLGLLGAEEQRSDLDIAMKYFQKLPLILYIGEGLGLLGLLVLMVMGKTIYPRWMAVLSPGALFLLKPLSRKLPKGLHMILCGGFSNVIFVIYYIIAIAMCCR